MNFKHWLQKNEMASFSLSPAHHFAVPCGKVKIAVPIQMPCEDRPVTAIDFRFEGPPPYEAPYNSFNNGSMFTAQIPQTDEVLVYHGYMKDPETMQIKKAIQLGYLNPEVKTHVAAVPNPKTPKMQYFHVPDYWYVRAELMSDNDVIKPALGDVSGERQQYLYGK